MENLIELLDPKQKTIIVLENKYHQLIRQRLLEHKKSLFNVQLLSIDNLFNNVMDDSGYNLENDNMFMRKLKIADKLEKNNAKFKDNINFINQLALLENEFMISNVEVEGSYKDYITSKVFNFDNLIINFDKLIIFDDYEFKPLFNQFIKALNKQIDITYFKNEMTSTNHYLEFNNSISLLDYLLYHLYPSDTLEKKFDSNKTTLIVCDDLITKDYLMNNLSLFGINTIDLHPNHLLEKQKLTTLFNFFNQQTTKYDYENLTNFNWKNLQDKLENINFLVFEKYLEDIYYILVESKLFELSFLNKLFSQLYFFNPIELNLFNQLLQEHLNNNFIKEYDIDANIYIGDYQDSLINFDQLIIVDASLKNFNSSKTSYLLNTKEREEISSQLISNKTYQKQYQKQLVTLMNCAHQTWYTYSLVNLNNKPSQLSYHIKEHNMHDFLKENPIINTPSFRHLSIHQNAIKNKEQSLSLDLIKENLYRNNNLTLSASLLDSFYRCPYQFFVSYLLKPRKKPEFSFLQLGNIYHKVIEYLNIKIITNNLNKASEINALNDQLEQLINQELQFYIELKLIKPYLKDYYLKIIKNHLSFYLDFLIYFYQYSQYHLSNTELGLEIPFENSFFENTNIFGKIDALFANKDFHFIVDYKSSSTQFKNSVFNDKLSNQLVTYFLLSKKHDLNPTGAFYKNIQRSFLKTKTISDYENNHLNELEENNLKGLLTDIDYLAFDESFKTNCLKKGKKEVYSSLLTSYNQDDVLNNETINEYLEQLKNNYLEFLEHLSQAKLSIYPFNEATCQNCDYKNICRVSKDVNYRKEEGEKNELSNT